MKIFLFSLAAAIGLQLPGAAIGADYIAIRFEAENYTAKSDRWTLTNAENIPDVQPDPDPPHHDNASGNANLELLPDSRVTHNDTVVNGGQDGNFWGGPGGGPRIDYNINIPEAGRYFVYVKTYSTGTEDNGLHVGINETKPQSGQRIQICSKHNWYWTSGQRTDENHCGVTKTIWLDVLAAGVNTLNFFAREDGFEIDQILLLKETHDGSLDCFPTFDDKVRCKNIATGTTVSTTEIPITQTAGGAPSTGPTNTGLAEVDLGIEIEAVGAVHYIDESIEVKVTVKNNDDNDTATNLKTTITLPSGLDFNASADCSNSDSVVRCDLGNLSAGAEESVSFWVTANEEGALRIDSQIVADQYDYTSANNTNSTVITSTTNIPDYDGSLSLSQDSNISTIDGLTNYIVTISNHGLQNITDAKLSIDTGGGAVISNASDCFTDCIVPEIATGDSVDMEFSTVSTSVSTQWLQVQLILANDAEESNNTAHAQYTVFEPAFIKGSDGVIAIEAEYFSSMSPSTTGNGPGWYLINQSTPQFKSSFDPDQANPAEASENAYLELLPDRRYDNNSTELSGITNNHIGGAGSTVSYRVFFHEAGEYLVAARIRANNSQDANIHVGIDNIWPENSTSLSVCSPDGNWQWTSSTRSGGACATETTVVEVNTPGVHTIMVSQDTDGLELDKLVLTKNESVISELSGTGPITQGIDVSVDTDISVHTSLSSETASLDEPAELSVSIKNNSNMHGALGIKITIEGAETQIQPGFGFGDCEYDNLKTICNLIELKPLELADAKFTVSSFSTGVYNIQTTVESLQQDSNSANNNSNETIQITHKTNGGGALTMLTTLFLFFVSTISRQCRCRQVTTRYHNTLSR